jgi:hypothetical protein
MKVNRVTVVIASTFLALSAATGVAAAAGSHSAHSGHSPSSKSSSFEVKTLTPWYRMPPGKVVYRPHMMCEEFNHDVMKDRRS